jgi:hypothetical protein
MRVEECVTYVKDQMVQHKNNSRTVTIFTWSGETFKGKVTDVARHAFTIQRQLDDDEPGPAVVILTDAVTAFSVS